MTQDISKDRINGKSRPGFVEDRSLISHRVMQVSSAVAEMRREGHTTRKQER